VAVRAEAVRHFDVIVVIWALTLMIGFMLVGLSRSELTNDQWMGTNDGPAWIVPDTQ
jgi:hypothetical protein